MPDVASLAERTTAADTDLYLVHVPGASVGAKDQRQTRANLLAGVARNGGNHNFGTSEITALTATTLVVATSLTVGSGTAIDRIICASATFTPGNILTNAGQTVTATVSGITATDFLSLSFTSALPDGLIAQAWISADNTISVRFHNSTGSTINGASYTARCVIISVA